jgi:hypothetical protein
MNSQQVAKTDVIVDDEYAGYFIVWHVPLQIPGYSPTGKPF